MTLTKEQLEAALEDLYSGKYYIDNDKLDDKIREHYQTVKTALQTLLTAMDDEKADSALSDMPLGRKLCHDEDYREWVEAYRETIRARLSVPSVPVEIADKLADALKGLKALALCAGVTSDSPIGGDVFNAAEEALATYRNKHKGV